MKKEIFGICILTLVCLSMNAVSVIGPIIEPIDIVQGEWGWVLENEPSGTFRISISSNSFRGTVSSDGNNYRMTGILTDFNTFNGSVLINGVWESFYGSYTSDNGIISGTWFWRRGSGWFTEN